MCVTYFIYIIILLIVADILVARTVQFVEVAHSKRKRECAMLKTACHSTKYKVRGHTMQDSFVCCYNGFKRSYAIIQYTIFICFQYAVICKRFKTETETN